MSRRTSRPLCMDWQCDPTARDSAAAAAIDMSSSGILRCYININLFIELYYIINMLGWVIDFLRYYVVFYYLFYYALCYLIYCVMY